MVNEKKIQEPLRSKLRNGLISSTDITYYKVFVGFNTSPGIDELDLIASIGGSSIDVHKNLNTISAVLSTDAIKILSDDPRIIYIEEIGIVKIAVVGKPKIGLSKTRSLQTTYPWGIDIIRAPEVHATGNRGSGVNVCIIDSGIDYTHEDLQGIYKGGYNFLTNTNDPKDDNGHGTHIAGIIAGQGMLSYGFSILGVSPNCNIYALKFIDLNGLGDYSNVVKALQWSIDNHMDIINMSFTGGIGSITLESAMYNAYNAGILLVAAAGNGGETPSCTDEILPKLPICPLPNCSIDNICFPALSDYAIAVASIDGNDWLSCFSSRGPKVELSAPGDQITSTYPSYLGDKYATWSGTSMSCPHVVGVAALIKSSHPNLTNDQIKQYLINGVVDLGPECFGYGRIDALKSVNIPQCPTITTTLII